MKIVCTKLEYYSLIDRCKGCCDCGSCVLYRFCGANALEDIELELQDVNDRPIVNLSGEVHRGLTVEQERILCLYGFDPKKVVVVRDDANQMLLMSEHRTFLLDKEVLKDG